MTKQMEAVNVDDEDGATPDEVKRARWAAFQQEKMDMLTIREALIIRHRVNKRVGAGKKILDEITSDLERVEKGLRELKSIEKEIKADQK